MLIQVLFPLFLRFGFIVSFNTVFIYRVDVKAYTNKAGATNVQGNIIIYTDQYKKEDFPVDYPDAKFFVIKSIVRMMCIRVSSTMCGHPHPMATRN